MSRDHDRELEEEEAGARSDDDDEKEVRCWLKCGVRGLGASWDNFWKAAIIQSTDC